MVYIFINHVNLCWYLSDNGYIGYPQYHLYGGFEQSSSEYKEAVADVEELGFTFKRKLTF